MVWEIPEVILHLDNHGKLEKVPIGNIYGLGKNFDKHIKESNWQETEPVVFIKPRTSLLSSGKNIFLPSFSSEIHYEVEMVLYIGKKGKKIPVAKANSHISGIGIGVDLTARDIQNEAKKKGHPWAICKGFDQSSLLSKLLLPESLSNIEDCQLTLRCNNILRQKANTSAMILKPNEIIAFLSKYFTLYPGDLIYTGTPHGVGKINRGDEIEIQLLEKNIIKLTAKFNFTRREHD